MINLGDKKWGVKDSGLLAYKQVGSKFFNKDFDFTRSSDATYIDKNGVLQTQSLYNLLDYSNDFSQFDYIADTTITANATTAPDGSLTASKIEGIGNWLLRDFVGATINVESTISIWIKAVDSESKNTFRLSNGGNNFSDNFTATNQWQRFEFTATSTGGASSGLIRDSSNNEADLYIWGMQVVLGSEPLDYQYTNGRVGIPRIDFSDGVGSLLLEPQRTNLVTHSANINNYLTSQFDATITYEYDISPDGTLNSSRVEFADSTAGAYKAVTISSEHTASIYVKGTAGETIMFGFGANVTVGSIYTFTGEWQRLTFTATSGAVIFLSTYGGATARDFEAFGLQLEAGSYATSYIKSNSGSTTTRTADLANNCGTEQDFNSEEGVLYLEASALAEGEVHRHIAITDGSFNNYLYLRYSSDSGRFQGFLKSGGGTLDSLSSAGRVQTDNNKIALVYKASEFSMWLNGSKVSTTTPTAMPIGLNELEFELGTSNPFYGKVRSVKYFPTALTDEELEAITT